MSPESLEGVARRLMACQYDQENGEIQRGPNGEVWSRSHDGLWAGKALLQSLKPIDMVLPCPVCGTLHVDAPEPEGWTNPPHKSHLCHKCGCIWRPADVPTNGVAAVKTRGTKDTFPPAAV